MMHLKVRFGQAKIASKSRTSIALHSACSSLKSNLSLLNLDFCQTLSLWLLRHSGEFGRKGLAHGLTPSHSLATWNALISLRAFTRDRNTSRPIPRCIWHRTI